MSVFIEIARLVTGMIVMLARLFRDRLVAMTVLIEIAGLVPGMFVMGTGFFLGHDRLPLAGSLGERSADLLGSPAAPPPIRVPLPAL